MIIARFNYTIQIHSIDGSIFPTLWKNGTQIARAEWTPDEHCLAMQATREALTEEYRQQWDRDHNLTMREDPPAYHPSEATARAMIRQLATPALIEQWELTEKTQLTDALPIVRGWLMDEMERRNPAAFGAWLESHEASPRKFFGL